MAYADFSPCISPHKRMWHDVNSQQHSVVYRIKKGGFIFLHKPCSFSLL